MRIAIIILKKACTPQGSQKAVQASQVIIIIIITIIYKNNTIIIIITITIINIIIIIIIIIVIIIMLFLYSPSVVFMVQRPVGPRKQLKQNLVNITGLRISTGGNPVGYLFNKRDRGCQLGTTVNKSGQQGGT